MSLKLKAEDNLTPIRNQIADLIKENSRLIEFGCGNGQLLLELSRKIDYGTGIDKSQSEITKALNTKKEKNISNIGFECKELGKDFVTSNFYDVATASLFFHVIPVTNAIFLLSKMKEISETLLICGFSKPKNLYQKALLWSDQRLTKHYRHFREYEKTGYLKGLFASTNISNYQEFDTEIPFLKIYKANT